MEYGLRTSKSPFGTSTITYWPATKENLISESNARRKTLTVGVRVSISVTFTRYDVFGIGARRAPVQEGVRCKAPRAPHRSVLSAYVRSGCAAATPQMTLHGQALTDYNRMDSASRRYLENASPAMTIIAAM